ncbi:MAG: DUF4091 domain-containing protein [Armatimonadota bacterium]
MKSDTGFNVYVVDALTKVFPDSKFQSVRNERLVVDAARNEYESAQLAICSDEPIKSLSVDVSTLRGASEIVPSVKVNFIGWVTVSRGSAEKPQEYSIGTIPGKFPDPLLDSKSVSVAAGVNQPVWLTVYVPANTIPGVYTGIIQVTADAQTVEVPIIVKVFSATVPDKRTLYLTNWFFTDKIASAHKVTKWSEGFWRIVAVYVKFMADYRQNTALTPLNELITGKDDGQGNYTFDFKKFDRWIELFKNAGIDYIEGSHLAGRGEWETKEFDISWPHITKPDGSIIQFNNMKVSSDEARKLLSQFLPALQKHLEEKGWLDTYIQHLADEPIPANTESYKKLASYVREFAPKFRIMDACMTKEIADSVDIWVPLTSEFDHSKDFFQQRQKLGDEVWFYTCLAPKGKYMNRFIDYPLAATRLIHWTNYMYGVTGYLHWGFNYWPADPYNELEPNWGGESFLPPGDSHIIYPGKRAPLSSIRLEALRDGVEDYELFKLLAKKNPKKAHEICESVIKSFTDYSMDPKIIRKARIELFKALED